MGAVLIYHWVFSFMFTFLYIYASLWFPKVRAWYGAAYGILITLLMHGILIPAFGFRYPEYLNGDVGWLWNLNAYELLSELIGHIFWSVSIEISLIAVLTLTSRSMQVDKLKSAY